MPSIGRIERRAHGVRRRRRACAAPSAAAISGLRIIVSATTARTPAASTSARGAASTASMTSVPQNSAYAARDADARHLDAERGHEPVGRALHRRAADDRAHARRPGRAAPRSASRMPGTARIGPIEITGFDGQTRIVSACVERVEHSGRRRRGVGARRSAPHDRRFGALAARTTPASRARSAPPSGSRDRDARADGIVGHRQQPDLEAPRARRSRPSPPRATRPLAAARVR